MTTTKITFPGTSAFFMDLKGRVDEHFRGRSRNFNASMVLKSAFWLSLVVGLLAINTLALLPFPLSLLTWAALGFSMACVGFNVGHDAIHGSYSRRPWVNTVLGWTFDVMGGSSSTWRFSHNVVHHTWTNVVGIDHDIEPGPFMRFHPRTTPPARALRVQHIYAWALYGFTSLNWVFKKDYGQLFKQRASTRMIAGVVGGKAVHLTLFFVLPWIVGGVALWQAMLAYVVMQVVSGFTLAVVFQLAHVVERVSFPSTPASGVMHEPWAEHEMRTTADFGRTPVTTFFTGGLDHQIEHHLFPRICHIHYRALAPIVEACARDHGLPYLHSGTFLEGLASHARTLRRCGREHEVLALSLPLVA